MRETRQSSRRAISNNSRSQSSSSRSNSSRENVNASRNSAKNSSRNSARNSSRTGSRTSDRNSARRVSAPTAPRTRLYRSLKEGTLSSLDGLRFIAILAVMVYHANVAWLPAGFVGVTLFFVLSGFLITKSILRDFNEKGSFDYFRFIVRRITKLFPQMLVMCGVAALLTFILNPALLPKIRSDVLPGLLFFENIFYIVRDVPYFAAAGLPSPLTHLWFMGLIMQFYLVWPLLLLICHRIGFSRKMMIGLTTIFIIASTIAMALMFDPRADTTRIYYGPDTRAAELLVGSLAALLAWNDDPASRKEKPFLSPLSPLPLHPDLLGLFALVAFALFAVFMNGYAPFPYRGGFLLMAIASALLVLDLSEQDSILALIIGNPLLAALGKRSFAYYLWHYPLFILFNPATRMGQVAWTEWAAQFAIIFAASELAYQIIDRERAKDLFKRVLENTNLPFKNYVSPASLTGVVAAILVALSFVLPTQEALTQGTPGTASSDDGDSTTSTVSEARDPAEAIHQVFYDANGTVFEGTKMQEAFELINTFPIHPDENGITQANVMLIGDSVPGACEEEFAYYFPNGHLDYKIGRQLYVGDDVYLELKSYGYDGDYIVYALGDNGYALEEDVRTLIDVCEGKPVYLVTCRVPESIQDPNNELFRRIADELDNVEVIDWYAVSEGHPEWFWDDGTHLRPEGAEAYTLMIREAITGV